MNRSFIENWSVRNEKSRKKILKEKKSFLIIKRSTQFAIGGGGDCRSHNLPRPHKYFTFCIIFYIIVTYLWKLQEDTNSIPRYRMAFFTYRSWSVNCDLPEIWTIWACLQVTCEWFILLSKCEQLNFVHWAKVLLALRKSYKNGCPRS